MNVLILYGSHEAPAIQDIYFNNPFKILEKRGNFNFNLVEYKKLNWDEIKEYHLVIISRIFERSILKLINFCKNINKEIFFFIDDEVLNFPTEYYLNNEPFYKNNESLIKEILIQSSALIVSTKNLQNTYTKYNSTIYITPPCLNINFIKQNNHKQTSVSQKNKFVIGYAGSFGHVVDFKFLEVALFDFYKRNQPNVYIEFMGCIPEIFGEIIDNDRIKLTHWKQNYKEYLINLMSAKWDIALCPVIDSSYTQHKSNIKLLEYSSSKIPGIYSDIVIYNKDVVDGNNGYLAKNNYISWIDKIDYAYNNRNLLESVSNNAYEYVVGNYSDDLTADIWQKILIKHRKNGISEIIENFEIKKNKAKRIYSLNGGIGLIRKLLKLPSLNKLNNIVITNSSNNQNDNEFTLAKISLNFDKKIIRKQILFIVPWLSVGGGDMVNLIISKYLDKKKYALHFITTEISDNEWEDKFKEISKNIFHVRKIIQNAEYFWEYNNLILEYVERANIDVIIVSNSAIGYTSLPALKEKFSYVKIIDILHGQGGKNEGGGFPEYSKPYDSYLDKRITINNYLKNYLLDKYNIESNKIKVIHNCVDTEFFNNKTLKKNKPFKVCYIGRLNYEKNPNKIVEIAECIFSKKSNSNITFEIIGDGPLFSSIENELYDKNLTANVQLKGYKDNIKNILENADALILCSEMEGLPIVILEAMSMGVPCIATNVGGIPELIDNGVNGFLVNYNSQMINNFVDKIERLYNDKDLRNLMSVNARNKIVKEFSILNMINAYENVINA